MDLALPQGPLTRVLPLITGVVVAPLKFTDRQLRGRPSGAALELFPTECEGSSDASLVEEKTIVRDIPKSEINDTGHAGQRAAATAFQAAVSEAHQKTKTKLTSIIETMRKDSAEQHAAELAQTADRHAEELQQVRADAQAEVTAAIEQAQQEIGRADKKRPSAIRRSLPACVRNLSGSMQPSWNAPASQLSSRSRH